MASSLVGSLAWAQEPPAAKIEYADTSALTPGARIRLRSSVTGSETRHGDVLARTRDTLALRLPRVRGQPSGELTLTLDQIDSLAIRVRRPGGAARGALLGFIGGLAVGSILGTSCTDETGCNLGRGVRALTGGLAGALVGGYVSNRTHGKWIPIRIRQ